MKVFSKEGVTARPCIHGVNRILFGRRLCDFFDHCLGARKDINEEAYEEQGAEHFGIPRLDKIGNDEDDDKSEYDNECTR